MATYPRTSSLVELLCWVHQLRFFVVSGILKHYPKAGLPLSSLHQKGSQAICAKCGGVNIIDVAVKLFESPLLTPFVSIRDT